MSNSSPYNWFEEDEEERNRREKLASKPDSLKGSGRRPEQRNLDKLSQTSYGNLIGQPSPADSRQSSYADYDNLSGRAPSGGDSSFYTNQPDYGMIPTEKTKPKYLHEFRNEIAGYDDELAKLHKQQYHTMVYEQDGKKLDELAERQAQLEKEKAVLKDRYYSAMGIGSEGKSGSENMLIGEGNNPNFSYDDLYSVYGIDKDNMLPNKGLNFDKGNQ